MPVLPLRPLLRRGATFPDTMLAWDDLIGPNVAQVIIVARSYFTSPRVLPALKAEYRS